MAIKQPTVYPKLPRMKRDKRFNDGARQSTSTANKSQSYQRASLNGTPIWLNERQTINWPNTTKTYVNNPDWKKKIAKGENATASYDTRGVSHFTNLSYNVTSKLNGNTSIGYGVLPCGWYPGNLDWTVLEDQALSRLKNKIQGAVGNASLAAPLAESREIHRLSRQISTVGLDVFKALLAAKKTGGKSVAKVAGDIWLGFGFGVNPLIKDMSDAANSILDYQERNDHRIVVHGSASKDWLTSTKVAMYLAAYGTDVCTSTQSYHKQSVRLTAGIDLKVKSSASYSVADHLGLKLEALPSVLWELTAFSWVVDYFTTVGPWLEDMFYTLPGVVIYGSKNRRYLLEATATPYFQKTFGSYDGTITGSGSTGSVGYFDFSRQPFSPTSVRSLRVKTADEIASNGLSKLLNLGSVLVGRRRGWGV